MGRLCQVSYPRLRSEPSLERHRPQGRGRGRAHLDSLGRQHRRDQDGSRGGPAASRFVVGGAVICLWAWATGRFVGFQIEPAEWRPLAFLGLLFSVQMAATNVGTWLTSAAHASVLLNLYAVHTVVLAHFLIPGDRLTVRKLAGVLIAYSGIVLLGARQIARGSPTLIGDVVVTVAGF